MREVLETTRRIREMACAGDPRCGNTRVIAIDGRSGAGKSTFANALAAELSAPVVSLEYLYDGWDGLDRGIDLLVSHVLRPLAAGKTADVPRYDWDREAWGEPWPLAPPTVLIVEGVGAGARQAAVYENVLVWLEAPAPVRKRRALDRDGETFAPYWDQWAAEEDVMLAREHTPDRASVVIGAPAPLPNGADAPPATNRRRPMGRSPLSQGPCVPSSPGACRGVWLVCRRVRGGPGDGD